MSYPKLIADFSDSELAEELKKRYEHSLFLGIKDFVRDSEGFPESASFANMINSDDGNEFITILRIRLRDKKHAELKEFLSFLS